MLFKGRRVRTQKCDVCGSYIKVTKKGLKPYKKVAVMRYNPASGKHSVASNKLKYKCESC